MEDLKRILKGLFAALVVYLAFAFANADFNIANWGAANRGGCAIGMVAFFGLFLNIDRLD